MKIGIKFLLMCLAFGFSITSSYAESVPEVANKSQNDSAMGLEDAIRLAEVHLSLKNVRWGKPTSKSEEPSRWILNYETPEAELRVLGPRKVTVNKSSGLVRVRDR